MQSVQRLRGGAHSNVKRRKRRAASRVEMHTVCESLRKDKIGGKRNEVAVTDRPQGKELFCIGREDRRRENYVVLQL